MTIYLVMYKSHERAEYQPVVAFKDILKAEFFKMGASISATQGYIPCIIEEIELRD